VDTEVHIRLNYRTCRLDLHLNAPVINSPYIDDCPYSTTSPENGEFMFLYCVSVPAAVIFAILFGIITILHIVQGIRYRKPFTWVVAMGAAWETIGFVTRTFLRAHPASTAFGALSQVLILLAPLWLNAFVYMILGRAVLYFVPEQKFWGITARRLALYFVLLDIA
jgi:hypothetical protein